MRKTPLYLLMALLVAGLLAACATPTPAATEAATEVATEVATEAPTAAPSLKVAEVTDTGGIDDKGFNATAWAGMEKAGTDLGVDTSYLESQQQTDYAVNIKQLIDQKTDLIVTVGFLLGEDTATAAKANPDTKFAIVDYAYDPILPNVLGLTFQTDQAAFLAGYLAAGMTKTGVVGTFGGIEIPPVTIFMTGYKAGVDYYNTKHSTSVKVIGTDVFAGNFESTDDGRRIAEDLISENADIIMPVAGPVGIGTAQVITEHPGTMLIWVDTDGCISLPDFCSVTLTSVMKNMDVAVYDAVKAVQDGTFEGGFYSGTLENNGVQIAPFHDFDSTVPADLKAELDTIKAGIIDGSIKVSGQ
jgi:basic membrane protein A